MQQILGNSFALDLEQAFRFVPEQVSDAIDLMAMANTPGRRLQRCRDASRLRIARVSVCLDFQ